MIGKWRSTLRRWCARCSWGWIACVLFIGRQAAAEVRIESQETPEGRRVIYRMTVTPAAEPQPALKHRFTVRSVETEPGNAVLHYLRAFPEGGISQRIENAVTEYGEDFHAWYNADDVPLEALPLDKATDAARSFDYLIDNFIARGIVCRDCDWGRGLEELRGPDILMVPLPEINASRSVARVLALRARVAIARQDYPQAINELRMIYRFAEHVGQEPLLVSCLVGIAEVSIANQQLIELMAAKDSPNMYWAIAELPAPIVSIRNAVKFEMSLGPRIFPFVADAEQANHTPQEWGRLFAEAMQGMGMLTDQRGPAVLDNAVARQLAVTAASMVVYPGARQRLLDGGMAAREVDAMPVGKVMAVDALREWQRVTDEIEKLMYVPYHVAREVQPTQPVANDATYTLRRGYGSVLAGLLLPAIHAARAAEVRQEWHLKALQVVEALRMHAAQTGNLPKSLDEIEVVPVPVNPTTGIPFLYRLEGKTAVLDLPFSDEVRGLAWRFEITLAE